MSAITTDQPLFHDKAWTVSYVTLRAGQLPPAEEDGLSYLKIPLNALDKTKAGKAGQNE